MDRKELNDFVKNEIIGEKSDDSLGKNITNRININKENSSISTMTLDNALYISSYPKNELDYIKHFLIDNFSDDDKSKVFLKYENFENIFIIQYQYQLFVRILDKHYNIYILIYLPILFPNDEPEFFIRKDRNIGLNSVYNGKINSETFKINLDYFMKFNPKENNIKIIINTLFVNFTEDFPIFNKKISDPNWKNAGKCVLDITKINKILLPKKEKNYSVKDSNNKEFNDKSVNLIVDYQTEINKLYKVIEELNKKNKNLEEKLKRFPFVLEENEKLITIIITSTDQTIHFPIACKNTSTFQDIEKELYKNFPDYSNGENAFLCKGRLINKFQTLEENNVKNGDILILNRIYY